MAFRKIRGLFVGAIGAGFVFGFGYGIYEDAIPESVGLSIVLGLMAVASVIGYWYVRELKAAGEADERVEGIDRRASSVSFGVLTIGLAVLASVLTFSSYDVPTMYAVWTLLVGGILVRELSIEYYRRQM